MKIEKTCFSAQTLVQMQTSQAHNVLLHVGSFILAAFRLLSGRVRGEQRVSFIVQLFFWCFWFVCFLE